MPRVASLTGARILQRFFLESLVRQPHAAPVREQEVAIGRDEVCHGPAEPGVTMEPETTVHRMNHPVATSREFPRLCVRSGVAGH